MNVLSSGRGQLRAFRLPAPSEEGRTVLFWRLYQHLSLEGPAILDSHACWRMQGRQRLRVGARDQGQSSVPYFSAGAISSNQIVSCWCRFEDEALGSRVRYEIRMGNGKDDRRREDSVVVLECRVQSMGADGAEATRDQRRRHEEEHEEHETREKSMGCRPGF